MRNVCVVVGAFAMMTLALADTRLNDGTILSDSPTWIVSYIEVAADSVAAARALIVDHANASRGDAGNLRFEALQRLGRENHFVILEAWTDPAAHAAHVAAAQTKAFRATLEPALYAPYDERLHAGLVATAPQAIPASDNATLYVLTHADIIPPQQFAPCNAAPNADGPCGNELLINIAKASRKHAGNSRFDVLTQFNRGNHMTVVEMWDNADAQAAHQLHAEKKAFRLGISSMLGSLWDERLYQSIKD